MNNQTLLKYFLCYQIYVLFQKDTEPLMALNGKMDTTSVFYQLPNVLETNYRDS